MDLEIMTPSEKSQTERDKYHRLPPAEDSENMIQLNLFTKPETDSQTQKTNLWLPIRVSLVAQMVKNLPEMHETWVTSLGPEDPLEKGLTTP